MQVKADGCRLLLFGAGWFMLMQVGTVWSSLWDIVACWCNLVQVWCWCRLVPFGPACCRSVQVGAVR